jgi:Leucine-rich repeat (LRR) protein
MKFLRILDLSGNAISDLEATLDALRWNTFLEHLELCGNPVAEEANYRLRVLAAIPSLTVLDKHKIAASEREAAMRRCEKRLSCFDLLRH